MDSNSVSDATLNQDQETTSMTEGSATDKNVSYETHKRLLGQRKSDQAKLTELQSQLQELQAKEKEFSESQLAEQNQFKELAERRSKELGEVRAEADKWKGALIDEYKIRAFEQKLPSKIKKKEYYNFIDKSDIIINPDSGEIDDGSLDDVVSRFLENYGDDVLEKKVAGKLPNGDALNGTPKTFNQLSAGEKDAEFKNALAALHQTKE